MFLVLRGTPQGHHADKRVSDEWVADQWVADVLGNCHGHIMAMTNFMAMAMGVPCYGHDHAMFAVRNMVMAMPWSWPCHGHGHGHVIDKAGVVAKAIILEKVKAKAL